MPGTVATRPGLPHQRAVAVVAAVGLLVSWTLALQDPVPPWELDLVRWLNGDPAGVAAALYPVMQMGTVAAPLVAAAAIWWLRRDLPLSIATVLVGLAAWFGAKVIKQVVGRERPAAFAADVIVRDGSGIGFGYISGHSAVAAATGVMVMVAVAPRHRWIVGVLAGAVGIARIVHGVHLPADVVGGWSFGTLIALGALHVLERVRPPEDRSTLAPGELQM